ncbi:MAG: serine/threonine-protein kinase, partial [Planctomycetaceae bacterium]
MSVSRRAFLCGLRRSCLRDRKGSALQTARRIATANGEELAGQLVEMGELTAWQARQLLAGEEHGFALAHFALEEPLGRGASGFVFRARDDRGRDRVLKVLHPAIAANPDALERFRREVRAAMSVRHSNVLTATETGFDRGLHFLAFEFHEGIDLRQLLNRVGRLSPIQTASIISQIAMGLQHVADQGMVHRDIKPSNILVSPDGTARLLDLGLARLDQASSESTVTETGQILGTIDYIPPEQAQDGRHADMRSDIYSLGCTMYHCLTGSVPYPNGAIAEKLIQHLTGTPRPITDDEAPDELRAVVQRAMERDPNQRFSTGTEFAEALSPFWQGLPAIHIPERLSVGPVSAPPEFASTIPLDAQNELDITLPNVESDTRSLWRIAGVVCLAIALIVGAATWYLRPEPSGMVDIKLAAEYPESAIFSIDGSVVESRSLSMEPGPHVVSIKCDGYEHWNQTITVIDDTRVVIRPELIPTVAFSRKHQLATLTRRVDDAIDGALPRSETDELALAIRKFASENPTSITSLTAHKVVSKLPSSFDAFQREQISPYELAVAGVGKGMDRRPPKELVGVIGDSRLHQWDSLSSVHFFGENQLLATD